MNGGSDQGPGGKASPLTRWTLSLVFVVGGTLILAAIGFQARAIWLPDMTEYAAGYAAEKWSRIKVGMSEDEVKDILGSPLEMTERGKDGILRVRHFSGDIQEKECYYNLPPTAYDPSKIESVMFEYSRPGKWLDSYNVRLLKLDSTHHVVGKFAERYND